MGIVALSSAKLVLIMNVNEKGTKGLINVIADLHEKGFHSFLPFDDYSPVDLIALHPSGKTFKIQVKYRESIDNKYTIDASSIVNGQRVLIDKNLIDGWAVYCASHNKIIYYKSSDFTNVWTTTIYIDQQYEDILSW